MKYGINTLIFTAGFTDDDVKLFPRLKDMGFDVVEISLAKQGDIDPSRVADELSKNSLACSSVCGLFGEDRDLRGPNEEYMRNSIEYIKVLIDNAKALGADRVVGPLYSAVGRANMEEPEARKRQWENCKKNLKEICGYAAEMGIKIGLEPLNRFETDFINICEDALKMVEEVGYENFGVHLDTFHMHIEEKDSAAAIRAAGDKLLMLHTCENDRGAPGTGQIHWDEIAQAIKDIGYDDYVVIESFTQDNEIIAKAASIWRQTEKDAFTLADKGIRFLKQNFG
jgi:D-psicose/D-tagatose/L-ribulose 3-epimerase